MSNTDRRPWTLAEFRQVHKGGDPEVLPPLLNICNKALEHGLTRDDVADVLAELARSHPRELPPQAFIDALQQRIDDLAPAKR